LIAHDAERALQRVVNLVLERERSMLEREAAAEALRAVKKEGSDPKERPAMPPLRGLSNEAAGQIINAVILVEASEAEAMVLHRWSAFHEKALGFPPLWRPTP
jgi:hypothetical protein